MVTGIFSVLYLMWGGQLFNAVPFKGDASFFITASVDFARVLFQPEVIVFWISAGLFWYFRDKSAVFPVFTLLTPVLGFLLLQRQPDLLLLARRYTAGYYLLSSPFILDAATVLDPAKIWREWRFALVPFVATAWIVSAVSAQLRQRDRIAGVLAAGLLLSTPLLVYYQALPYAELPAILFLFLAVFSLDRWYASGDERNRIEVFVFLAAGLLFKETLLIPTAAISALLFFGTQGIKNKINQLPWYLVAGAPVLVYWFYRKIPYNPSGFDPSFFADASSWKLLFSAFSDQLGFFLVGLVLLAVFAVRTRLHQALLLSAVLVLIYLTGNHVMQKYLGYSRYTLLFLPLSAGTVILFWKSLTGSRWRYLMYIPAVSGIIINLNMLPVSLRTGLRTPGWGDYRHPTSEFDYPYDKAWAYLAEQGAKTVVISGRSYLYMDSFYAFKYRMKDLTSLDLYIKTDSTIVQKADFRMVQDGPGSVPVAPVPPEFVKDTVFSKGSLHVSVWRKTNGSAENH
jgi:hypothetical protein